MLSTIDLLQKYESQNVTYVAPDRSWPIIWQRAQGVHVWDEAGKKYLDLTAAFGVASTGHANARVVRAGQKQMAQLLHAMGDVHPHRLKAELARELSYITFERWNSGSAKTIFSNSGFEAVESALKTAMLASGKPGVIAFTGGYHGLGYGALNVTHREEFKIPFRTQLREFATFVPFPVHPAELESLEATIGKHLKEGKFSSILVEPIQARGGINIPPPGFLPLLRKLCDRNDLLLILDEIYTGFGRTGKWFACEHENTVPDLICLGKALTGGFPLSACVGRADIMNKAWPPSAGEALHTSTFLGHPVGCAMALAQIKELKAKDLVMASRKKGTFLLRELKRLKISNPKFQIASRGAGLLAGVEMRSEQMSSATELSLAIIKRLLHRGFIFLPEGEHANVIAFSPPLIISDKQLKQSVSALQAELTAV
jgi:4-aminobutyrate aminotransferase-like enzyme